MRSIRHFIVAAVAAGFVASMTAWAAGAEADAHKPASAEGAIQYWTCPMHPDVKKTEAGKCPICSMDLKPVRSTDGAPAKTAASPTFKQTTCPVCGMKVKDGGDVFLDHHGLKVYFCSNDCRTKFKSAPSHYLPALYRQIYPQSVQVICPVMGNPVDPKVSIEHKGHTVYFCCDGCDDKFRAEPAKYAAKLKDCYTDQVHCPVDGKPIDPGMSTKVKGEKVYFCSKECLKAFKAAPEKYAEPLLPEAGLLARGPVADEDWVQCPACLPAGGQHQRKDVKTLVHDGKVYFLCGDSCVKAFKADPAKYIRVLAEAMKKVSSDTHMPATGADGAKPSGKHGG